MIPSLIPRAKAGSSGLAPRSKRVPPSFCLDWPKHSGRAPSRRGGLQPFIEAPTRCRCSCSKSAGKTPAWVAPFIDPRKVHGVERGVRAAPLILPFYPVEILFELINARYEQRSILITANQPFGERGKIFPDQAMTIIGY